MRIVKDTEIEYRPFLGTLHNGNNQEKVRLAYPEDNHNFNRDAYTNDLNNIIAFQKAVEKTDTIIKTTEELSGFLKQNLEVSNAQLFFFNKTKNQLNPIGTNNNGNIISFITHLNNEGSIDWIFENNTSSKFTELVTYTVNGNLTKLIIIPIFQRNKRKGILLLTALSDVFINDDTNYNIVQSSLIIALLKIESILHKLQAKEATKELQLYQSKMLNDNRLLAVGEMAIGAVEEILNPMQVILSYTDMLALENNISNQQSIRIIKEQIDQVTKVISNLMKFSRREDESVSLKPININALLKEYYKIIESSVCNKNYEIILDLQRDVPMVISNRDYIFQLLTNIFAIILSADVNDGGILLQTKYSNNFISLRVVFTGYLNTLDSKNLEVDEDLSIGIIRSIMEKHEGSYQTNSNPDTGSTIVLNFPVQRRGNGN